MTRNDRLLLSRLQRMSALLLTSAEAMEHRPADPLTLQDARRLCEQQLLLLGEELTAALTTPFDRALLFRLGYRLCRLQHRLTRIAEVFPTACAAAVPTLSPTLQAIHAAVGSLSTRHPAAPVPRFSVNAPQIPCREAVDGCLDDCRDVLAVLWEVIGT